MSKAMKVNFSVAVNSNLYDTSILGINRSVILTQLSGDMQPCIPFQASRLGRRPDGGSLPRRHPRPPGGGPDDAGERARQGGQEHRPDQAGGHAAAATAGGKMSVRYEYPLYEWYPIHL